ncbi:WD40 repeat domain-containing protein, partial [Planctomycetota bacterium]
DHGVVKVWEAEEAQGVAEQAQETAETLSKQQEENLYFNHIAMAHQELQANRPVHALNLLSKCPKHLRHWEWNYLRRKCQFQKTPFLEFDSPVVSFEFNPDGSELAVLCVNGRLVIRDYITDRESTFQVRQESSQELVRVAYYEVIQWITFSPDSKYIAVAVDGNNIDVMSLPSGKVEQTLAGHTDTIVKVVFTPDGTRLATAGLDGSLCIWDHHDGKLLRTLSFKARPFYSLAFSPDGKLLFTDDGQINGNFRTWNSQTGEELKSSIRHSGGWILDIEVSSDGKRIATASWDNTIVMSSEDHVDSLRLTGHTEAVVRLAFTKDGQRLVSISNDMTIRVWDTRNGREILKLSGLNKDLRNVAFWKEDRKLIVSDGTRGLIVFDGSPVIEEETKKSIVLQGHDARVLNVAYFASGDRLVSASEDGSIRIWNTIQGEHISSIEFNAAATVAISPEDRWIAASGWDRDHGVVKVWEATPPHRELFAWKGKRELWDVSFGVDSQYLIVVGSGGVVRVFDWQANLLVCETGTQEGAIYRLSTGPGGRFFATTGFNREVVIWDATRLTERQQGRTIFRGRGAGWAEFGPDSRRLAVGDRNGDIIVLDVESGERLLLIPNAHGEVVFRTPFSPDGKYLASCSFDQTIRVWEASTGKPVDILIGHEGGIYSVVWSPDSKHVASAGADGTVRIWTPRLK